ncbi:SURF1 family protein [Microlunatus flavus]|uniref:SURF1-like protein n=1 Tax=Microlunatus flavus TaxID=1036181 RepID=A0A1H9B810_9ACTN|nr:SURF1 family protein [Microlunatus flavus]SEP84831.1 Cytochrome oxidase assembly protein ShyY1 [Microlunatus flavus]
MSTQVEGSPLAPSHTWLKQTGVVALGVVLAAAMVVLGLWQLDVYERQGTEAAARKAAEAPLPLTTVAPAGGTVGDGFGRRVTFTGTYDPGLQLLVPTDGGYRVVTGLKQADGSVVAVVRGQEAEPQQPVPPAGEVTRTGVLLPSEEASTSTAPLPAGQVPTIRLPSLAQTWPGPLVGGFVTLDADSAGAEGLAPVAVDLPEAQGRLRNGAYALQWWVFAAFALGMSIRVARDLGRLEERELDPYA